MRAFVWDGGLYEYTRAPFGQKGSGNTFIRAVQHILQPIKKFTASFVDDLSVYSNGFDQHLIDLEICLQVIKKSGFTLNLKKCQFAQHQVKFLGHIIGSGESKPDPDKVATIKQMKVPETKKQVYVIYVRSYNLGVTFPLPLLF